MISHKEFFTNLFFVSFTGFAMLFGAHTLFLRTENATTTPTQVAAIVEFQNIVPTVQPVQDVPAKAVQKFDRDLTLESEGEDVALLQRILIEENKGPQAARLGKQMFGSGYFGGLTQAALAEYQEAMGISPAGGFFGSYTREHFNKLAE